MKANLFFCLLYAILQLIAGIPVLRAQNTPATAQAAILAPGIISGPVDDAAPAFTPDGKTVYFHRRSSSLGPVIMVSHWRQGKWSEPVVAPFSGQWSDIEPTMAPDGSYLIFASNRPAIAGGKPLDGTWNRKTWPEHGGNLWRVDWQGDHFGEPYRLPDIINSSSSTFSPSIAADGSLYFMQPVGEKSKFHIYRAAFHNGQYEKPEWVSFSAADTISDFDPAVAPDESFLIFGSGRPTSTRGRLFIVYRKDGQWGEPVPLGDEVNQPTASPNEARLSPDHRTLYFSSAYQPPATYPATPAETRERLRQSQWFTESNNIWFISLDSYIPAR